MGGSDDLSNIVELTVANDGKIERFVKQLPKGYCKGRLGNSLRGFVK